MERDISGASNPAELSMNAPRSVAASFAPAPVCGYLLSSNATTVAATGDLRKVNVSAASGCAWQAASNAGWVTVVSGASGAGNGSVRFRVEANTNSTPRGATLTIGDVPFTITQAAGGAFSASRATTSLWRPPEAPTNWRSRRPAQPASGAQPLLLPGSR